MKVASRKSKRPINDSSPLVRCAYAKLVAPSDLKANPRNPNKHPDHQLDLYGKAIEHQGWRRAVVVSKRSGLVVTGHGAVQVAIRKGWPVVPVDYQDFASAEDETAHLLADNQLPELAELSQADVVALLKELDGKIDLDLTGFGISGLEDLSLQFNVNGIGAPTLASGDRSPFQQMTFTLHDEQAKVVRDALMAVGGRSCRSEENENTNGNALAAICADYLQRYGAS